MILYILEYKIRVFEGYFGENDFFIDKDAALWSFIKSR